MFFYEPEVPVCRLTKLIDSLVFSYRNQYYKYGILYKDYFSTRRLLLHLIAALLQLSKQCNLNCKGMYAQAW